MQPRSAQDAPDVHAEAKIGGWKSVVLGLAIVAITLATYVPALHGGFVWDDYGFFIDNPLVENPHGLHDIWLSTESQDYFALTSTMLWAEWQAWGMNPVGYHVVNVLLHAAAAVLLWRVLRRLRIPGAWLGAALFAVHPVATLSAAWITEGKNTLSLALYLLALWAFLDYDERGGKGRYFLSLAAFLLALLAKGSVVVLPFVLLLCAWWRRDRITRKDVARSLPFFALALVMGLVTTWFQWHNAIRGGNVRLPGEGADSIIAASGWVVWFYLFKDLLPAGLTAIYPRWEVDGSSLPAWLPLLLLIGGLAWLWMRRKTWGRAPLFAAAYFLIGLLPVLGFIKMSFMPLSLVSDHFQYVAMIGIMALAGGILARAVAARGWMGRMGIAAAACCLAVLACAAWDRSRLCGDEVRFWQDNLEKNSSCWFAWNNLACAYQRAGRYADALKSAQEAVRFEPGFGLNWYALGNAYAGLGQYDRAIDCYKKGIETHPVEAPRIYDNWAAAYVHIGRDDLAVGYFDKAISGRPKLGTAYNNRGAAYARLGKRDLAIQDYTKAIELKPRFPEAYLNRGRALADAGRLDEALSDYSRAIELKPDSPDFAEPYYYRAVIFYEKKEYGKALEDIGKFRKLGGKPSPQFLKDLDKAAGLGESGR
ncbi:MAG: tetratricopeptide repeat protein [Candidatus Brocadiia bacterium]